MKPGALVVGGDYRGLGVVRSLGRQGIDVWVVHDTDTLATRSRYCRRAIRHRVGRAAGDGDELVGLLLDLAERAGLDRWVLFPTSDETAWPVSRHWAELSRRYRLTTPAGAIYAAAADKIQVHQLATALGIGTPRTWLPRDAAELAGLDLEFPLIVKPARRTDRNPLSVDKAWRADDRDALLRRYEDALTLMRPEDVMIQELIPGGGDDQYAFGAVCRHGDPLLSVVVVRARQYPWDFGRASTFVETVDHPGVAKDATRLLQELRVDGPVEVEFKLDRSLGTLKVLDVNVRVWGWHSIGAPAGVDFAHAAYRLALGEPVANRTGRAGVRWARVAVDAPSALRDVAARRLTPAAYLRSVRPPLAGPIGARDDPLPALFEVPLLLRTEFRHRRDIGRTGR